MKRGWIGAGMFTTAALLAVSAGTGATGHRSPTSSRAQPLIRFSAKARDRLVLVTPGYRLTLRKQDGSLLEVFDRRAKTRLLHGQNGCMWSVTTARLVAINGCSFTAGGINRFSYRWNQAAAKLTLRYQGAPGGIGISATAVLTAGPSNLDLRLTVQDGLDSPILIVLFPADLYGDADTVKAAYTPTFLPGIRLLPGFFKRPHENVERYPSRWAFADYLSFDAGASHLSLYSVNPAPLPLAPVDLGFMRRAEPSPCSGQSFCITHAFQTWTRKGETWSSPLVRMRIGDSARETILDYRQENGIDSYPSLAAKVGSKLETLVRAPLVKADVWKGLPPFRDWPSFLRRLPSPALVHPVAFQPGGQDENYPDFLPPDPEWGSTADFAASVGAAHALGQLVMPYLNISWWNTQAPSVVGLPPPLTPNDISMVNAEGKAVTESFGGHNGYIVSPSAPFVRGRIGALLDQWRTDVPADCLFFDQIGARPWRRDFNAAAATPVSYEDAWLSLLAPLRDRCLMVEDGWDRLASSNSGFHGGLLLMERGFNWPNRYWGAGNWEPFPLALWLLHDKVLLYQHDLYEETMTADPEVLTFNLAFGFVLSYNWDGNAGTLESPWMSLVGRLQRALGPLYAGRPLTDYRVLGVGVTETEFGDFSVIANWNRSRAVEAGGYRVAPLGFLARDGGRMVAGTFGDTWQGVTFGAAAR